MAYYNKSGNVVTLKPISNSVSLLTFIIGSPLYLSIFFGGWIALYAILFEDIYRYRTNVLITKEERVALFFILVIPYLLISIGLFRPILNLVRTLIFPNLIELGLKERVLTFKSKLKKQLVRIPFDSIISIQTDLIRIYIHDDLDIFHRAEIIYAESHIIFLTDREEENSQGFDVFYLRKMAAYFDVNYTFQHRDMLQKEYSSFRKNELEAQKNDPRKKYYLSHK